VPETLTLDDGHDGALLDSRRALETVGVDTAEELSLQVHVVEGVGGLIVVGLDLACQLLVCGRSLFALRLRALSACRKNCRRAAQILHRHSPSATSSRPLSAMIAVAVAEDYWLCL
jgi:hypothetical protein